MTVTHSNKIELTRTTQHTSLAFRMNKQTPCNCSEIGRIDRVKYLGTIFDKNLKRKNRIDSVIIQLRKIIDFILRVSNITSKTINYNVYYAFIRFILNYGIIAWEMHIPLH